MNLSIACERDVCEQQLWFGGAAGRCNNQTGACVCPPGFGGSYILSKHNDCHVSTVAKQVLNGAVFSSALSGLVMSLIALVKVLREISQVHPAIVFPSRDGFSGQEHYKWGGRNGSSVQQRVLRRKILVVINLILCALFAICEVYRTSILLLDSDAFAEEFPWPVAVLYRFMISCSISAFFLFSYIYTTSLPKGGQLAAVLGVSWDADKYRRVTNWVFKYNVIVCLAIPFAATWWFAAEVEPVYSGNFVVIEIVLQLLIAIDIYAALLFVYFMNVPLFQKVIQHSKEYNAMDLPKLRSAVWRFKMCVIVGPPSMFALIGCAVISSVESRFNFIHYTLTSINESLLLLFGSYVLGWDFVSIEKTKSSVKSNLYNGTTQFGSFRPDPRQQAKVQHTNNDSSSRR